MTDKEAPLDERAKFEAIYEGFDFERFQIPALSDFYKDRQTQTAWEGFQQGWMARSIASPSLPEKLWLWQNFVGGRPEYWAFDNPYPTNMDNGDPQTLGEPCGYALFKPSRTGRTDVSEEKVLAAIVRADQQEQVVLSDLSDALAALENARSAISSMKFQSRLEPKS